MPMLVGLSRNTGSPGTTHLSLMIVETPNEAHRVSIISDRFDINSKRAQTWSSRVNGSFVHVVIEGHALWHGRLGHEFGTINPGSCATSLGL